jgi:hypothetical protein
MKHFYILVIAATFLNSSKSSGQTLTATGCNPTVGEASNFFVTSYFSPGSPGSGQTWNFSGISGTQYNYNMVAVASTPFAANFPMANIAQYSTGTSGYKYLKTSSTALQSYGDASGSGTVPYSNPIDLLHFPFSLNNSFTDTWYGFYTSSGYTWFENGTTTVIADGSGTLITPAGTFPNTLRLHVYQTYRDSANAGPGSFITDHVIDQYLWYQDGIHFELAASVSHYVNGGSPITGGRFSGLGLAIEDHEALANNISVYPNPFIDELNIVLNNNAITDLNVELTDVTGRVVLSKVITKTSDNFQIKIDEQLHSGIYFLQLSSGDNVERVKLVKQ